MSTYSTRVVIDDSDYRLAYGHDPKFCEYARDWCFVAFASSEPTQPHFVWPLSTQLREITAEIAAAVEAPAGSVVTAYVQP